MSLNVDGFTRLAEADVERRRVFVRADLDCPLNDAGELKSDEKLVALVPTLRHLLEREAQVVVGGHLGTESGEAAIGIEPCAARLAELLDTDVYVPDQVTGMLAQKLVNELRPGKVVLLANLLSDPREASGDAALARDLGRGVEVYVGDCLAAPPGLASMVELPRLLHTRAIGAGLERELVFANRLRHAFGNGFAWLVSGSYGEQWPLLEFAATRPGVAIVCSGELARVAERARASRPEPGAPNAAELSRVRSWLALATARGVRVEIADGEAAMAQCGELLGRARAVLVTGATRSGHETALLSSALLGTGPFVAVRSAADFITELTNRPGVMRTPFVSTAGAAFEALLCEQKLSGLEALRRVV